MKPSITYITDRDGFEIFCRRLQGAHRLALDTEFVGEDTFVPRLELIQLATDEFSAVVDVPAVQSLEPLAKALGDPDIEKIFHAGRQDMELFYTHTGAAPSPIFDTQIAAAMVGYGTQIAYAHLVQRVVGVKLDKAHTYTNWSQRPLSQEQLAYALDDVRYLLPVHQHLKKRLEKLERLEWVQEEFSRLQAKLHEASRAPVLRYQRIRGWENLRPRAAAVLKELALWREQEAQRRNVPRGRIVRDEVLLELARQAPATIAALKGTRGLHAAEVDRNAQALLAAVRRGLAVPQSEWPEIPPTRKGEPEAGGQVELLQAVLKALALEAEIAPSLLASAGDLQTLVEAKARREQLDLPILQGWRRKLAGAMLLDVIDGHVSVHLDRHSGRLRLARRHERSG